MTRQSALVRLKQVETEFAAVRFALAAAIRSARHDAITLRRFGIAPADLRAAYCGAESTYIVRLFAQFEGILRSYFSTMSSKEPRMEHLLNRIASRLKLPSGVLDRAHEIRGLRNDLIHQGTIA